MLEAMTNLEQMKSYIEDKFSSDVFEAKATTTDEFGPVVKWDVEFVPKGNKYEPCSGSVWCAPDYYTAAVPFSAR